MYEVLGTASGWAGNEIETEDEDHGMQSMSLAMCSEEGDNYYN